MPSDTELTQLDNLVRERAQASTVRRLRAPDRIENVGGVKVGYFTYVINTQNGEKRAHVDWRIERGNVHLISVKLEDGE